MDSRGKRRNRAAHCQPLPSAIWDRHLGCLFKLLIAWHGIRKLKVCFVLLISCSFQYNVTYNFLKLYKPHANWVKFTKWTVRSFFFRILSVISIQHRFFFSQRCQMSKKVTVLQAAEAGHRAKPGLSKQSAFGNDTEEAYIPRPHHSWLGECQGKLSSALNLAHTLAI